MFVIFKLPPAAYTIPGYEINLRQCHDSLHYYIIIQLTPHWGFSVTDYIEYYAHLCYLLSLDYLYLYNNCDITFLTVFIPVNSKGTGTITWRPSLKPLMTAAMYVWSGKYDTEKMSVFDH